MAYEGGDYGYIMSPHPAITDTFALGTGATSGGTAAIRLIAAVCRMASGG